MYHITTTTLPLLATILLRHKVTTSVSVATVGVTSVAFPCVAGGKLHEHYILFEMLVCDRTLVESVVKLWYVLCQSFRKK